MYPDTLRLLPPEDMVRRSKENARIAINQLFNHVNARAIPLFFDMIDFMLRIVVW